MRCHTLTIHIIHVHLFLISEKTKIPGTPRRLSAHDMLSESVAITDIGEIPVYDSEMQQEVMTGSGFNITIIKTIDVDCYLILS